ncbi:MAG TPA: STAS domain-containing protein [Candidatus Saccharimonadales bacterium]|nr:STAS domain-containing protein [Candidatus Saccharimonadales bacterium]
MNLTTSNREIGVVTIVDVRGRIVLGQESAALRSVIDDLLKQERKLILLNLAEASYIDSAGLGTLVSSFASVKNQGGQLKLLNLTNKVRDLLQITKLYTVFDVRNDEVAAVNSFHEAAAAGV